jgi:hypothetical protein
MTDSSPIIEDDNKTKNTDEAEDFAPMMVAILKSLDYKYYILMFFIFMFITSDVFYERILNNVDGALEFQTPTPYGTIIQAVTLIVSMILVHILIKKEIL